jgi:replication fork protection complex subunit Tof1/Swi1
LLIDAMATSPDEADVEVAEILQHQLYYNGDILDSSLEAVTRYKEQSIGFLEAVVTFAYVLLRMLERYSKTRSFMMVRKRQAARNKRKAKDKVPGGDEAQGTMPEEYGNEEDEEYERGHKEETRYKEHQFTFKAFEMVSGMLTAASRAEAADRGTAFRSRGSGQHSASLPRTLPRV